MPTDKERREVAQRLRERAGKRVLNLGELLWCIGCDDGDDAAAWNRLADLIEPSCDAAATHTEATATRDVSQCRRSDVDRDALLALADEMDDLVEAWGGKYPTNRVAAYARSIREALGEVSE